MTFLHGIQSAKFYANSGAALEVDAGAIPTGALPRLFTVSPTKKVRFSKGNLQFQASTSTWRFAEHQHDYVGDNTKGTVYVDEVKCSNNNIAYDYTGWIDLFGWGTSGVNHGAESYYPWATSGNFCAYGNPNANLFDDPGTADWGYNAISNGGNTTNYGWRTLTTQEWQYLLGLSGTAGVNYRDYYRRYFRGNIRIDDVNYWGVIIFPDSYDSDYPYLGLSGATNPVPAADWEKMQSVGAVFIPAAGRRNGGGNSPDCVGTNIWYWSSTRYSSGDAHNIYDSGQYFNAGTYSSKASGYSVRLVIDR